MVSWCLSNQATPAWGWKHPMQAVSEGMCDLPREPRHTWHLVQLRPGWKDFGIRSLSQKLSRPWWLLCHRLDDLCSPTTPRWRNERSLWCGVSRCPWVLDPNTRSENKGPVHLWGTELHWWYKLDLKFADDTGILSTVLLDFLSFPEKKNVTPF